MHDCIFVALIVRFISKQTDEAIDDELSTRNSVTRALKITKNINFIVVGPFVQEAIKGTGKCIVQFQIFILLNPYTVNLHIERMNTAEHFSKNCVLLAIRPVKIADKDVSKHFCKYEPAEE